MITASNTVPTMDVIPGHDNAIVTAELFTIPLEDDKFLVYAPLRRAAFAANSATVNTISDFQNGIPDGDDSELTDFLRELGIVDGGSEQHPVTHTTGDPCPTSVSLFLTTACNLRCTYCYASAGDTSRKRMSFETAKSGIDFVIRNATATDTSAIGIAYHGGGEPTSNWKVLTDSFDYACQQCAENGMTVNASLASNGVLRDDQIDWIIQAVTIVENQWPSAEQLDLSCSGAAHILF